MAVPRIRHIVRAAMRRLSCVLCLTLPCCFRSFRISPALAQAPAAKPRIEWEVKNRFRLFRSESDFQRHVAAWRNDGVLGSERRLAVDSDGRGWARDTVERLCVDRAGRLMEFCERDGTREVYLSPSDHRIGVVLAADAAREPSIASGPSRTARASRARSTGSCDEEMRLRVVHGRPTTATVDIVLPDGTAQRVVTEIQVRDVLIAGLGDSIAAGEGNPDRPVRLSDEGFCFRRFLGVETSEFYRPGPRRLQRQPLLRRRGDRSACRRLGAPERALALGPVPPLALQLPDARRARPRDREPAHRRHLHSAGLLGRDHRRRLPRLAAHHRMPEPGHQHRLLDDVARAGRRR